MAQTVLVTGASGVLGSAVTKELLKRGTRVMATSRDGSTGIKWDLHADSEPATQTPVDAVIHCAAAIGRMDHPIQDADDLYRTNVGGTATALVWAIRAGVKRFIHASGALLYGGWRTEPATETTPIQPWLAGHYALSKWGAESVCVPFESQIVVAHARLTSLYGIGYESGLIPRLVREALREGRLEVAPPTTTRFHLLHVRDAANALANLADRDRPGILNIGGEVATIGELAERIGSETGSALAPGPHASPTGRGAESEPVPCLNWVDDAFARSEGIHQVQTPLSEGLKEVIADFRLRTR